MAKIKEIKQPMVAVRQAVIFQRKFWNKKCLLNLSKNKKLKVGKEIYMDGWH